MKTRIAGCFVLGAAVWLGGSQAGLPPLDYSLAADSQPQAGVPRGTLSAHTLAPGKFFPGTPHNYQVYVPAQYDASRPAAFMIFLDGSGYAGNNVRVPVVLDNLIARRDVPPMIAMFIDPGVMPALSDQAQNRYERIFEYDSLTPRFANFLIEELVAEVAKRYNLSKDPNDRGIAGISTGGVGAFVAAWNRPDQFRRVITWVGSFGNFRGADRLPGLIRRTEPRPLRVFMQTGRQDLVNYAGSWYLENPRMAAALEFAGNDVKIELGEDGHSNRHGASILPDTLRWLWRDYPQPITVGEPQTGAGRGLFAQLVPRRAGRERRRSPRRRLCADLSRQTVGTGRRDLLVRGKSGGGQRRQRVLCRPCQQQNLQIGRRARRDRVQGKHAWRTRASRWRRWASLRHAAFCTTGRLVRPRRSWE